MQQTRPEAVHEAARLIEQEALRAISIHGPMRSGHEGKAVIEEELDELWEAIKRYPHHDPAEWRKEATHLGAMAVRFLADVCNLPVPRLNCPDCGAEEGMLHKDGCSVAPLRPSEGHAFGCSRNANRP